MIVWGPLGLLLACIGPALAFNHSASIPSLDAIFASTRGANWSVTTGWAPGSPLCGRHGVTCGANGFTLQLNSNGLSGTLPSSLDLPGITQFKVSHNSALSGSIPTSIAGLTGLTSLDVSSTALSGVLPAAIGQLTSLTSLMGSRTLLSGMIPQSLSSQSALRTVDLSRSRISGTVFAPLANKPQLFSLHMGNTLVRDTLNGLGGLANSSRLSSLSMPSTLLSGSASALSKCTSLTYLDLSLTAVSGVLPSPIAASRLGVCLLHHTSISGQLSAFSQLHQLAHLDVSSTSISGGLSSSSSMSSLAVLAVSSSAVSGDISSYSLPSTLTTLLASHTKVSGELTSSWAANASTRLTQVVLSNTAVSGVVPPALLNSASAVRTLDLSLTAVSGPVPSIGSSKLTTLLLHDLHITGSMPVVPDTLRLARLDVSRTSISGPLTIPAKASVVVVDRARLSGTLSAATVCKPGLNELRAGGNALTGSVPQCWNGSYLSIFLGDNQLTSVPSTAYNIGQLDVSRNLLNASGLSCASASSTALTSLDLSGNALSMDIMDAMKCFGVSSLRSLAVSGTGMVGALPGQPLSMPSLELLDASYNQLHGTLPAWLFALSSLQTLNLRANSLMGTVPHSSVPYIIVRDNPITCVSYRTLSDPKVAYVDVRGTALTPARCNLDSLLQHNPRTPRVDTTSGLLCPEWLSIGGADVVVDASMLQPSTIRQHCQCACPSATLGSDLRCSEPTAASSSTNSDKNAGIAMIVIGVFALLAAVVVVVHARRSKKGTTYVPLTE